MVDRVCGLLIATNSVSFIERVTSVKLGLVEERRFIVFVFFVMMQHILLFLWNEEPILKLTTWLRGDS